MEDNYENEIKNTVNGVLHWNYRQLTSFPEELRVHGKSILDIYMKGNLIGKMPTWIMDLGSLTELHLCENYLVSLPEEINRLTSLQVLDVTRNRITKIPESLTLLKSLNVFCADGNMISYLPNNIGNMKALRILSVAQNQLKYLPESIYFCVSLEEIILDHNALLTLPPSMFHLSNLKVLSVYGNAFVYFPSIRPIAEPRLILGSTNFLKWLTYDLLTYIIENDYHPEGPLGGNFNTKSTDSNEVIEPPLRRHSTIFVWRPGGRDGYIELKLPFSKPYQKEVGVPTLYELCVRFIHNKLRQNTGSNYSIRNTVNHWKLPETIRNDLISGPTAYCQTCKRALFENMIIRVYEASFEVLESVESYNISFNYRTKIIVCCCSSYCSRQYDSLDLDNVRGGYGSRLPYFSRNFTELDWTAQVSNNILLYNFDEIINH